MWSFDPTSLEQWEISTGISVLVILVGVGGWLVRKFRRRTTIAPAAPKVERSSRWEVAREVFGVTVSAFALREAAKKRLQERGVDNPGPQQLQQETARLQLEIAAEDMRRREAEAAAAKKRTGWRKWWYR